MASSSVWSEGPPWVVFKALSPSALSTPPCQGAWCLTGLRTYCLIVVTLQPVLSPSLPCLLTSHRPTSTCSGSTPAREAPEAGGPDPQQGPVLPSSFLCQFAQQVRPGPLYLAASPPYRRTLCVQCLAQFYV